MKGVKTGGRKKGTPNKLTIAAREAIEYAFAESGGEAAFAEWATDNRTEFYKLYAKLLPLQLTGDKDAPLVVEIVRFADTSSS